MTEKRLYEFDEFILRRRAATAEDLDESSCEFESDALAQMAEDGAGQGAGGVPDDVVHVGHARGEEVLPPLDGAGESQAEQDCEYVRLQRRALDGVQGDEEK